jgi:periodic tryptophan protein 2
MKEEREVKLTCAAYHKETHILITGFSNGSFLVQELPEVNHIHSLRYASFFTTYQIFLLQEHTSDVL